MLISITHIIPPLRSIFLSFFQCAFKSDIVNNLVHWFLFSDNKEIGKRRAIPLVRRKVIKSEQPDEMPSIENLKIESYLGKCSVFYNLCVHDFLVLSC
jgi:hypothetical protein